MHGCHSLWGRLGAREHCVCYLYRKAAKAGGVCGRGQISQSNSSGCLWLPRVFTPEVASPAPPRVPGPSHRALARCGVAGEKLNHVSSSEPEVAALRSGAPQRSVCVKCLRGNRAVCPALLFLEIAWICHSLNSLDLKNIYVLRPGNMWENMA